MQRGEESDALVRRGLFEAVERELAPLSRRVSGPTGPREPLETWGAVVGEPTSLNILICDFDELPAAGDDPTKAYGNRSQVGAQSS
jgi:hypothetical protein